jgi:hypothetical protein
MNLLRIAVLGAIAIFIGAASFADVPIPPNYQISSPSDEMQNEEQIAVNPLDSLNLVVAFRDRRIRDSLTIGIGVTTDGGDSWNDFVLPDWAGLFARQSDPALTVDKNGVFYLTYVDFVRIPWPGADSSYLTTIRSTDGGQSWLGPSTIPEQAGPYIEDKEFITIDNTGGAHDGNLYVAWKRAYKHDTSLPDKMMFSRSTDGGLSFSDTLLIGPPIIYESSQGIDTGDAGQGAQPIVGKDGSLYVFWVGFNYDYDGNKIDSLTFVKSTDGGVSFTSPSAIWPVVEHVYIDGDIRVYAFPSTAVDIGDGSYDGNLYVMFANETDYEDQTEWNIYIMRSMDDGQTWTEPYMVNDDDNQGPNPPYDQFHPWLYCNQDGVLVCIFYDQRTDPENHTFFDAFAAYSFDGGQTFTTNHRLSDVSINPEYFKHTSSDLDNGERPEKLAEYIGITVFHDRVNAVWSDSRNENWDVYGTHYTIPLLRPRLYDLSGDQCLGMGDSLIWATCWHEDDISYQIEIDDDEFFGSIDAIETVIDNRHYIDVPGLDGEYYYRINAIRPSDGHESDYSLVGMVSIDTDPPAIAALASPEEGTKFCRPSVTFEWTATGDTYEIEIAADPEFSGSPPYFHYSDISTTSFTLPDYLDYSETFYWHVNSYDSMGNGSGFSAIWSFDMSPLPCGDVNGDCYVNIGDAVALINYVFKGGPAPDPVCAGDANGDGNTNVGDAVYLIAFIFSGGGPPVEDCCP